MSELRYNLISGEWVIIATERAKRPEDFVKGKEAKKDIPEYRKDCPFCPGNEDQTPEETLRFGDTKDWRLRAVFNKFGALSPNIKLQRQVSSLHNRLSGYGTAEVIIESRKHNTFIVLMSDEEAADIIKAYKERYLSVEKDKSIEEIIIFKNHGVRAGTSLEHPHSQLIAVPVVPPQIRVRLERAARYFDQTGKCIFCQTLKEELKEKSRLVYETEEFVSFIPYASLTPFHMWIFPRKHMSNFSQISNKQIQDLAICLKKTLGKLYYGLSNPDFNYTIRSTPAHESASKYYHWYISIIPRITQPAGFELGSGMFINTSLPEESSAFLRNIK